jgi:hypothetical protein
LPHWHWPDARSRLFICADGRAPGADPVLNQQFEMDRTICQGQMQKANVSGVTFTGGGVAGAVAAADRSNAVGQVGQGCMAEKGYVAVPQDQVAERQQELAAIAAENARREAAAAAPPPPEQPPRRTAAIKPKAPPAQPVSLTVPQN